jgi:hypothetical protein
MSCGLIPDLRLTAAASSLEIPLRAVLAQLTVGRWIPLGLQVLIVLDCRFRRASNQRSCVTPELCRNSISKRDKFKRDLSTVLCGPWYPRRLLSPRPFDW